MGQLEQQVRISLENSTGILCDECKNDTFTEVVYLRRVSKLLTGSPDDMIMNIPVFACSKCGHINKQFRLIEKPEDKPVSKIIQP